MSAESAERAALGPNSYGRMRREARQRKAAVTAIVVVLLVATFVLVTGQTGFPGPGPMRRYPTRQLQEVVDRLNGSPCGIVWGGNVASVDWVRSRVHLSQPWVVAVAPAERSMIENPGPPPTGMIPTWSMAVCPTSAEVG